MSEEHQKTVLTPFSFFRDGAILLIFLCGFLLSGFYAWSILYKRKAEDEKVAENIRQMRLGEQIEEKKKLSSYGWIDKEKKIVHIPIDEAMEDIVKEYKSKTSKASGVYLPGIQRPSESK
ncbi:hypothetical protein [Methylacidiphilum caldifontis]|uniref:Septation ring formation regulator EzrA n=1 Tax=Methylacidiphilum caldifontis TaxID=2795386 RepID=A0A4Y8PGK0_9BACT|nr:hypothetical protein [Methylacidiphilum caldifontis]TFE71123.1 hypothetical protein A7Q10_05130 [Methylacidiphilum caldifontis]